MPKNTQELKLNKTAGTVVDVPCIECKRSTKHKVLTSADLYGEDWFDNKYSVNYDAHYQIIQCQGCETISFKSTSSTSEDIEQTGPDEFEYVESTDLYPSRNEGRIPLKDSHLLPANVQRIYEETVKV